MVDALDLFPSESSKEPLIPAQGVSLAGLQSSRVPIDWYEAIAIVQDLCRAIVESGDEVGPAALGGGQVFIDSSGKVSSTGRGPKDARTCVQQLGELLRATLPEGQFPTPLRLVVSQAVSAPPFYSSIREFSEALAYFERPNRTALIQSVYERGKTTQARSAAPAVPRTPQMEVRESRTASRAHRGRIAAAVAAAVIVATLAGVGAWMLFRSRPSIASSASSTVRHAGDTLKTATSAVDAILDRILPRPRGEPAAPPKSAPAAAPAAPRRSTRIARAAPPSDKVVAFDLETSSVTSDSTAPPPSTPQPSVDGSGAPPPDVARKRNDLPIDPVIYTASDAQVAPPVAVYPQLPSELPPGVRIEDLAIIELIVTEAGNVGSVRVREAPKTMSDTMLVTVNLSAAKTWRFRPALKDGQPVKYRKAVWILTH